MLFDSKELDYLLHVLPDILDEHDKQGETADFQMGYGILKKLSSGSFSDVELFYLTKVLTHQKYEHDFLEEFDEYHVCSNLIDKLESQNNLSEKEG